jgi:hypothetical protein
LRSRDRSSVADFLHNEGMHSLLLILILFQHFPGNFLEVLGHQFLRSLWHDSPIMAGWAVFGDKLQWLEPLAARLQYPFALDSQ